MYRSGEFIASLLSLENLRLIVRKLSDIILKGIIYMIY